MCHYFAPNPIRLPPFAPQRQLSENGAFEISLKQCGLQIRLFLREATSFSHATCLTVQSTYPPTRCRNKIIAQGTFFVPKNWVEVFMLFFVKNAIVKQIPFCTRSRVVLPHFTGTVEEHYSRWVFIEDGVYFVKTTFLGKTV